MASKLRVDEIVGAQGSTVSIGTATFTGGLSGDITGLNVTGVITATTLNQTLGAGSSITIGNTVITSTSIGIGTTTTAGRNAGVGTAVGTLVYDVDSGLLVYNGSVWQNVKSNFSATGGTLDDTSRSGYNIHTFTSPGSLIVIGNRTAEYLVIAGGGAGGSGIVLIAVPILIRKLTSPVGSPVSVTTTGSPVVGTVTYNNIVYTTYTFNSSGTFLSNANTNARVLVVGGGGGAAYQTCGGGGAGGYNDTAITLRSGVTYTITVGAGGTGGVS